MDELNRRWLAFNGKLKEDDGKLSEAKEVTAQFAALQRSIKFVVFYAHCYCGTAF